MRKFTIVLTALCVIFIWGILSGRGEATTTFACTGAPADEPNGGLYPEVRQFVDIQSWWTPGPGQADTADSNHGHLHLGACIPERETLDSGNLDVAVRALMHNNPGGSSDPTKFYVSMVFKGTDYETTVQKLPMTAMYPCVGTCQTWLPFSQPLSKFNHSGLQEVRFRGFVPEPRRADGILPQMRDNANWQLTIQNGKSIANVTRMPWVRGKGWYPHSLYCESTFVSVPIPNGPVSGVWTPTVKMDTHSSDASLPVTHYVALVDPDFHAVPPNPGTVLLDADGRLPASPLTIDTATLANGTHKLHLRADCRDDALGSTNSGVTVIPFVVAN